MHSVKIGKVTFIRAHRHSHTNDLLFTVSGSNPERKLNFSSEWLADVLKIDVAILNEMWNIMHENDEEGLVMWKLTYSEMVIII